MMQQQNNYNYTHSPKPAQLAHLASVRKPAYTQTQKFKSKSVPPPLLFYSLLRQQLPLYKCGSTPSTHNIPNRSLF